VEAVEQIAATRSGLLMCRARIALAARGRDVLKEKRDQLMEEFRRVADVVLAGSGALDRAAAQGRSALAMAEAAHGAEEVMSIGLAARREIRLQARTTTVMGVRIADIEYEPVGRPRTRRGYTLAGSSVYVDRAAEEFESEIALILELAAEELRLRRLVNEIGTTTRRVNALESVVIPRLERERRSIQSILDERERQDHFRLKRFMKRRAARIGESQ
jgi:H(+)-transporting ATP synthase subunit D